MSGRGQLPAGGASRRGRAVAAGKLGQSKGPPGPRGGASRGGAGPRTRGREVRPGAGRCAGGGASGWGRARRRGARDAHAPPARPERPGRGRRVRRALPAGSIEESSAAAAAASAREPGSRQEPAAPGGPRGRNAGPILRPPQRRRAERGGLGARARAAAEPGGRGHEPPRGPAAPPPPAAARQGLEAAAGRARGAGDMSRRKQSNPRQIKRESNFARPPRPPPAPAGPPPVRPALLAAPATFTLRRAPRAVCQARRNLISAGGPGPRVSAPALEVRPGEGVRPEGRNGVAGGAATSRLPLPPPPRDGAAIRRPRSGLR